MISNHLLEFPATNRISLICPVFSIPEARLERVGMPLNLRRNSHDIDDSTPEATFTHVASELGRRKIAFIIPREPFDGPRIGPAVKRAFGGAYIANQDFTKETAEHVAAAGEADAVAFGKWFLANPDLPARLARNTPLNRPDETTDLPYAGNRGLYRLSIPRDRERGTGKVSSVAIRVTRT
jgi:2,4-dienoyl-CoA reductase-like NADH-dependent reductase (Old Yellow Enzyme family)